MNAPHRARRWRALLPAISALAMIGGLAASPAQAADVASLYKGKTVRIVVGFGPGGGYDAYARMIAPYLEKEIGASVIVENQPGAGGLIAINRIAMAKPDGLQMMLVNGTAAGVDQILDTPNVRYDLAKMDYLGIVSASPWVWQVAADSKLKTVDDFLKRKEPLRWAGAGPTGGLSDGAAMTCEALKIACKVVIAYQGSNEAALAVFRGEMDAIITSDSTAANYVKSGQAIAVTTIGRKRSRFLPDTPTVFEAAKLTPDQEWWFDFRANLDALGRVLVITPNTPKDQLEFLQAAVKRVLTNEKLIAEGEKTQRYVEYIGPEETKKIAVSVGDVTPAQKQQVIDVVMKKYR
ncbi:MAG TPA: tripartite tricarboxylate transporter substrate binding protein [Alphaproteobacteria bacterium]|jgi:tripartite-type tricarboxylate transporter receptor subunit TctC